MFCDTNTEHGCFIWISKDAVWLSCLLCRIGIQPNLHIFLQIAVEELVVVQVVHSIGEDGQHRGIFLGCHIGHFQGASHRINIGSGELRNFDDDVSVIVGEAGAQILLFPGRGAVGFPVQRIDGQRFGAAGNHQRVGDGFRFAVERNNHTGVVLPSGKLKVGVLLQLFLGDTPANGVAGHQQVVDIFVGEAVFQQAKAHVSTLGEPGQDDGLTVVVVLQIIGKGILHILIGRGQISLAEDRKRL